ncbi:MAG: trypsin-like serine protease [Deltaproteobacteria bacterium]
MKRVVFVLALTACGGAEVDAPTAILFGEPVQLGDFPSVGFVGAFDGGRLLGSLCTASLISTDTVLTAAHCLEDARVGTHDVYFARELTAFPNLAFATDRWSRAEQWSLHPDYVSARDGLIDEDLALVFLDEPLDASLVGAIADEHVAPYLVVGAPVTIVGYGDDENGLSGPLNKAKSFLSFVNDDTVRVGGKAPEPSRCSGDSGGPTFMVVDDGRLPPERIISVNSFGLVDCDSASTELRVDTHLDWMLTTMQTACDDGLRSGCADGALPRFATPLPTSSPTVPPAPTTTAAPDFEAVTIGEVRAPGGCTTAPGTSGITWVLALGWLLRRGSQFGSPRDP